MLRLKGRRGRVMLAPLTRGHTSKQTNIHKRADTCRHTRETQAHRRENWDGHTHGLIGEQSGIHTLLGSRANFKGVSIFRPEQLDPTEMDQAHQSPACAWCPEYNGWAGCFGERGSPSQSN